MAQLHRLSGAVRGRPGRATRIDPTTADAYLPIHLRRLRVGTVPAFDIFVRWRGDFVLYRHRSVPFDEAVLAKLLESRITTLYVAAGEAASLHRYEEGHLDAVLADVAVPVDERASTVIGVAEGLARDLLAGPIVDGVERVHRVTHALASFAVDSPEGEDVVTRMIQLLGDGSSLAVHSANTAIIATALGRFAPDVSVERVATLAVAGLLHDVGMTQVPEAIRGKPGPLTTNERELVEAHPAIGEEILRHIPTVSEAVVSAVRNHHERLDGSGYPGGIRGRAIPWNARALALAEVYDALTSNQPYRARIPPYRALHLMLGDLDGQLDGEILRGFIPVLLEGYEPGVTA